MAELYIRIRAASAEMEWLVPAAGGAPAERGSGELGAAAPLAAGRRVVVIVPGEDVLLTRARIPGRSERDVAHALPYALEDCLAQAVDELHFARGPRSADGEMPVAVVSRSLMAAWVERLAEARIRPQAVIPDSLALPLREDECSVLWEERAAVVRLGEYEGFSVEQDLAPALIAARLRRRDARPCLRVFHGGEAKAEALAGEQALRELIVRQPGSAELLDLLSSTPVELPALNLLQGDFAPTGAGAGAARRWWPAAALLLLALGVHLGLSIDEYRSLEQRREALQSATMALFHKAFPQVHRLVNPRLQAEQELAALRTRQGAADAFLGLLLRSGAPLQGDAGLSLQGLSFRNGELVLRLEAREVQALERYKQRLAAAGLNAEVLSAEVGAGGVDGRVLVRGRAP